MEKHLHLYETEALYAADVDKLTPPCEFSKRHK